MKQFDIPIQENGRMILPAELRRALGVGKGDRILIQAEGDRIEITTTQRARHRAQERFRALVPDGEPVVDTFLAEKRVEVAREDEEPRLRRDPKTSAT